jgi:hypothetical protein
MPHEPVEAETSDHAVDDDGQHDGGKKVEQQDGARAPDRATSRNMVRLSLCCLIEQEATAVLELIANGCEGHHSTGHLSIATKHGRAARTKTNAADSAALTA